ncbi:MAG: nucleotide exchange factor GrpE [Ardenticatenales bacterium]|nr:nucleotide exchange factor GrpE [Ardenticatenales bacterium]
MTSLRWVRRDPKGEASPSAGGDEDVVAGRVDGDAGSTSPDLADDFVRELAEARRTADENHDQYLRALAEMQNIKRRNEERLKTIVEQQRRDLLLRFLDVADNLERALANAGAGGEALVAGVDATYRDLERLLEREGVERVAADGAPFDPMIHEATGVVPVAGLEAEQVVAVERNGYTVRGELLRPARVVVGQPGG